MLAVDVADVDVVVVDVVDDSVVVATFVNLARAVNMDCLPSPVRSTQIDLW